MFKLFFAQKELDLAVINLALNEFVTEAQAMTWALEHEVGHFEIHDIEQSKQYTIYHGSLEFNEGLGTRAMVNRGVSTDDEQKAIREWNKIKKQGLDCVGFDRGRRDLFLS